MTEARTGSRLTSTPGLSATVGILMVIVVWQVAVIVLDLPNYVLPSPWEILTEADWPEVARSTGITSIAVLLGCVAGQLAGFLLAVLAAASLVASGIIQPISVTLRSVPVIAIAPLLTLYLGRGIVVTVAVGALIVFFPTLVNMSRGFASPSADQLELMHALAASQWQVFRLVRWPASLPYLFASLKIAATSSVLGAIVAEWIGSDRGLGYLIVAATFEYRVARLWATIAVSTALALAAFLTVVAFERLAIPWRSEDHE